MPGLRRARRQRAARAELGSCFKITDTAADLGEHEEARKEWERSVPTLASSFRNGISLEFVVRSGFHSPKRAVAALVQRSALGKPTSGTAGSAALSPSMNTLY